MTLVLKTSALQDIEIKRIQGQSILDFYPQIMRVMKNAECSSLLMNMFAEPNVNRTLGRIVWKTSSFSKSPISLGDCSPSEYSIALSLLEKAYQECVALADLFAGSVGSEAPGPTALRAMLSTPDLLGSVFLSGDQVIVTEWGCIPVGAIPRDFDLIVQSARQPPINETTSPKLFIENQQSPVDNVLSLPTEAQIPFEPSTSISDNEPPSIPPKEAQDSFIIWRLPLIGLLCLLLIFYLINCYCLSNNKRETIQQPTQYSSFPDAAMPQRQNPPQTAPSFNDVQNRLQEQSVTEGDIANISLAWRGPADLDLLVIEPNGSRIDFNNRQSSFSDGSIDIDANRCTEMQGCPTVTNPVENISWRKRMPAGQYKILIGLYSANIDPQKLHDIPYSLFVTYRGKRNDYSGVIKTSDIVCEKTCHSNGFISVGVIDVVQ
jgi:hypothetical protein